MKPFDMISQPRRGKRQNPLEERVALVNRPTRQSSPRRSQGSRVARNQEDEEVVSLIDHNDGRPTPLPEPRRRQDQDNRLTSLWDEASTWIGDLDSLAFLRQFTTRRRTRSTESDEAYASLTTIDGRPARRLRRRPKAPAVVPWTFARLMRYLCLSAVSAMVTFIALGSASGGRYWNQYQDLLQPDFKPKQRCYYKYNRGTKEACTCPKPETPLKGSGEQWMTHHKIMVQDSRHAHSHLDVVFLGDALAEQWNGTANLGTKHLAGMRGIFEQRFTTRGGGKLEGLSLGSASDTGPNLLWHIQHGLIDRLNPKVWVTMIGTNDLYVEKCRRELVVASILNVVKAIAERKPSSQFIIHGILPRKDRVNSTSQERGSYWQLAQEVHTGVRQFCDGKPQFHFLPVGMVFTITEQGRSSVDSTPRRPIDKTLMDDGLHPTRKGMEKWGDTLVTTIAKVIGVNITDTE